MEGHVNTTGREWKGGYRASAECDIQDKQANVRVSGKPRAAAGVESATDHRGGRRGDFGSPEGRRAHLALAGVAGVWWGQLRPQQVLCAVTQGLCGGENAMWWGEGQSRA